MGLNFKATGKLAAICGCTVDGFPPFFIYNSFDKPSASYRGCPGCIASDGIAVFDDSLDKSEADGSWRFSWRQLQTMRETLSSFVYPSLRSHYGRSLNFHFSHCWLRHSTRQMLFRTIFNNLHLAPKPALYLFQWINSLFLNFKVTLRNAVAPLTIKRLMELSGSRKACSYHACVCLLTDTRQLGGSPPQRGKSIL